MLLPLPLHLFVVTTMLLTLPGGGGVDANCHDHRYGVPSKSCKRIKDEKFQIRGGVKIVPMWQYLLLKEPSHLGRRVKRGAESVARGNTTTTAHMTNSHFSGRNLSPPQRQFQIHRYTQNAAKTHDAAMPPVRHSTLIQPIDSHAPLPVQRHVVQRQVQASIFSTNIAHQQAALVQRKYKRQENYPTAVHSPAYPTQAPPPPPPLTYPTLAPVVPNYATQPAPIYQTVPPPTPIVQQTPQAQQQQQVAGSQGSASNDVEKKGGNEKSSKKSKSKKKKKKEKKEKEKSKKRKDKKRKEKTSKMCKMCEELSSEESSEERDIACEICDKSTKSRKHGKDKLKEKEKEKGLLQTALKVRPIHSKKQKSEEDSSKDDHDDDDNSDESEDDESPEGEGAQDPREGKGDDDDDDGDDDEENHEDGDGDGDSDDSDSEDASTTTTTTFQPITAVSAPTIIDFVERAKQNKLMRIPVYRGKKLGAEENDKYAKNGTAGDGKVDAQGNPIEEETSEFASNIRDGPEKPTKYSNKPNVKYSYPPKDTLPLQTCFHNPSGYVCCNLELNNVVESTYKEIREQPNFNPCNLQVIANKVQRASEKMFEHPFESIVSHADFAQNINFAGDLVCKLEIDGKYMIAYGTPYHADDAVGPQGPDGKPLPVRSLRL